MRFPTLLAVLLSLLSQSSAAIHENVSSLPALDSYDFIVVGGGVAGCVLANRLSEKNESQVLLIEAGPSDREYYKELVQVPYYTRRLKPNPDVLWDTTFVPQPGLNGRTIPFVRASILGGATSLSRPSSDPILHSDIALDGMVYTRGAVDDYNRYAELVGDDGWSWEALQPYFQKIERYGPPVDGHNTTGKYDPAIHGTNGVVNISLSGHTLDIDPLILQATDELGGEYQYLLDMNDGTPLGVGWMQSTIGHGGRASAGSTYLSEAYLSRPNLHVLVETTARRVFQSELDGAVDIVEVVNGGTTYNLTSSKEIILTSGVVGSPHLLLASGIGNATTLANMNIPVIRDLPSVGQNLSEQPFVHVQWHTNSNDNFNHIMEDPATEAAYLAEWRTNRTGPLTMAHRNLLVWLRLNETDPEVQEMFETYGDPAPGKSSPHIEFMPDNGVATPNITSFDLQAVVLHPLSRGSVTLNSSDPFGSPLLDGGFFTHPLDMFLQKQAVLEAIRMASAPAFANYIIEPFASLSSFYSPGNATIDDAALEQYIRNTAQSDIHMVGSVPMSPRGAEWGVVDPDLKVKGLRGLRVVDASVIPFCPAAHTQAPVYVFAERAADIIKADYL